MNLTLIANDLVPVYKTDKGNEAVSARELHQFLGSKKQFADWIKLRVKKYGLIENQDYASFHQMVKRETGGTTAIEYVLTLDAAKELAMVEGNAKGKEARQYFIECERRLKMGASPAQLSPAEMKLQVFRMLEAEAESLKEQNRLLTETILEQAPAVQYNNEVLKSKTTHTTTSIAKELGVGAQTLNDWLKRDKIQYPHNGHYVLYAAYQDKDYTRTRTHSYPDSEGNTKTSILMVWTEAGREFIHKKYNQRLKVA